MHSERAMLKQGDMAARTYLSIHRKCTAEKHVCNMLLADQLRDRATSQERALWERLQHGVRGHEFIHSHRIFRYVVDFYSPSLTLVIEVDGPIHRYRKRQDNLRQAIIRSQKVSMLRFTNDQVDNDLDSVIKAIEGWMDYYQK